jgi:glycosyltransferase EpsE
MKLKMSVTVLLSVYNSDKFLNRCFSSLKAQTCQDFTILCVNDASTDASLKIIKHWKSIFSSKRFTIINNSSNQGLTRSLNIGLNVIKSAYTARIDADDWWDETKLTKQLDFAAANQDYGVIGCNYCNVVNGKYKKIILPTTDVQIKSKMIATNPFAHSCVLFKTDLIKQIGAYDSKVKYGQDYDLWLRCLPLTKFYNLQELLCFRHVGSGISVSNQKEQMFQCIRTRVKYIQKYHLSIINYSYLLEPLLVGIKSILW